MLRLVWKVLPLVLFLSNAVTGLGFQDREDQRASQLREADQFQLVREEISTRAEWVERSRKVRKRILLTAGLWPEPDRGPLNARIFEEVDGEGFSVAKVHFESLPGYLVTGNLYRPAGAKGPFPAVLTPHGHWQYGRLQDGESGSIPARCIDLARMGFVVFSIDMIGYNDSFQLPHDGNKSRAQMKADRPLPYESRKFRSEFDFPHAQFYGLSLGGLQLWNGIRSLDFLSSLSEVDGDRIGVTGASGGATQTLLLMAVDNRVKVAAPVNIIGVEKHPGCRCENIPGLWIETSTLEVSATFAPRPLLLVSASEDPWTHSTPQREYPMIREYYELLGVPEMVGNHHVEAGHNYNAESRKAVYEWFFRHLSPPGRLVEDPRPEAEDLSALGDLRVFPDGLLPPAAKAGRRVIEEWVAAARDAFDKTLPGEKEEIGPFQRKFRAAMLELLAIEVPDPEEIVYSTKLQEARGEYRYQVEMIGRSGRNDWIELEIAEPAGSSSQGLMAIYEDHGQDLVDAQGEAIDEWAGRLLKRGVTLFHVRGFASGEKIPASVYDSYSWSDAYNRPNSVLALQDILTALQNVGQTHPDLAVTLIGLEGKGILAFFTGFQRPGP